MPARKEGKKPAAHAGDATHLGLMQLTAYEARQAAQSIAHGGTDEHPVHLGFTVHEKAGKTTYACGGGNRCHVEHNGDAWVHVG